LGMISVIALLATSNPGTQVLSQPGLVVDTKASGATATNADIALIKNFSALDPTNAADLASVSKYFSEDAAIDLAGPEFPVATKGVTGVHDFLKWFGEAFVMKLDSMRYYPGPEAGQVLWFWKVTSVCKATGKTWSDNGIDDFRVKDGKIVYVMVYWGHPSRLAEALSP